MTKTFITGATGDIGSKLLEECKKSKVAIRVLSRRQEQVDKFRAEGIDAVAGGLNDVDPLAKLMQGCDTLILNAAAVQDQLEQCTNAIDAALKSGVKWIIKISAADARLGTSVPWATAHYHADSYLRERTKFGDIAFTILCASAFMSNLLAAADPIKQGFFVQSAGDGKCGWVDTQDAAEVCHQMILDGPQKYRGKEYILTGPALITMSDIADALTRHVGHKVRYVDLPGPVYYVLLRMGLDEWNARGLVAQFNEVVRPNLEGVEVSSTIQDILGRPATSIDEWVAKNKERFAGRDSLPYLQGAAFLAANVAAYIGYQSYVSN